MKPFRRCRMCPEKKKLGIQTYKCLEHKIDTVLVQPTQKEKNRVVLLDKDIFSVRKNLTGLPVRVFVNMMETTGNCSDNECYRNDRMCPHRIACDEVNHGTAEVMVLNLERLSEVEYEEIKNYKVWKVTDEMFAVRYGSSWQEAVHVEKVMDTVRCDTCPSRGAYAGPKTTGQSHCKHELCVSNLSSGSQSLASLATTTEPESRKRCRSPESGSQLEAKKARKSLTINKGIKKQKEFDPISSCRNYLQKIKAELPSFYVAQESNKLMENIPEMKDVQNIIDEETKKILICCQCEGNNLTQAQKKTSSDGHFIDVWKGIKINIPIQVCRTCKTLQYPNLLKHSMFFIKDTIIISHQLFQLVFSYFGGGVPLLDNIGNLLELIGLRSKLTFPDHYPNIIYKGVLGISGYWITGDDLDEVSCPECGKYPHIVYSDGNQKDVSTLKKNITCKEYISTNEPVIEDLQTFTNKIAVEQLAKVYRTGRNKTLSDLDAFTIPPIMAPIQCGESIKNSEYKKNSYLMNTEVDISLHKLADEIQAGTIDRTRICEKGNEYTQSEIDNMYKRLVKKNINQRKDCDEKGDVKKTKQRKNPPPTTIAKREVLKIAAKKIMMGDSDCHKYVFQPKKTQGYCDMYCEHLFKVASKMIVFRECPADHSDIRRNLHMPPTLHVIDDACSLTRFEIANFPDIKEMMGDTKGGFAVPNESEAPPTDVSWPMLKSLVQLDDEYLDKRKPIFVAGHRLQERKLGINQRKKSKNIDKARQEKKKTKKQSTHSSNLCRYHSMDIAVETERIPSMVQESMQNNRNRYRVPFDKTAGLEASYLFNYVNDYIFNKKRMETFKKKASTDGYKLSERDEKWRIKKIKNTQNNEVVVLKPGDLVHVEEVTDPCWTGNEAGCSTQATYGASSSKF